MSVSGPDKRNRSEGSRSAGEPLFLAIGRLRRPHGVKGEIIMEVLTDFPERLKPGINVHLGPDYRLGRIVAVRPHGKGLLVRLEGIATREAAGELRNQFVSIPADQAPPLPEGEYYHHELLGLRVVTEEGRELGTLSQILVTGANDVYLVSTEEGGEVLLPAIESVILDVDLKSGEMRVHLLPGLIP